MGEVHKWIAAYYVFTSSNLNISRPNLCTICRTGPTLCAISFLSPALYLFLILSFSSTRTRSKWHADPLLRPIKLSLSHTQMLTVSIFKVDYVCSYLLLGWTCYSSIRCVVQPLLQWFTTSFARSTTLHTRGHHGFCTWSLTTSFAAWTPCSNLHE
jgi:hypothetical protein